MGRCGPYGPYGRQQEVDWAAVQRCVDGDGAGIRLNFPERREAVAVLHGQGLTDDAIAERVRFSARTMLRIRHRLGLEANYYGKRRVA